MLPHCVSLQLIPCAHKPPFRLETPDAHQTLLNQFSNSMDELTARVSTAVVQVRVTGYRAVEDKDEDETGMIGRQRSLASGVIVDPNGCIITNAHVVKGAQRIRVFLTPESNDGSQVRSSLGIGEHPAPLEAKIAGIASTIDLALLKVEAKNLPTLPFADYRNLKKGQIVLAFGNPEGLENSVTMGIVSAVARQADPSTSTVYIQTDAPINPGNSGGPLAWIRKAAWWVSTRSYSRKPAAVRGWDLPFPAAWWNLSMENCGNTAACTAASSARPCRKSHPILRRGFRFRGRKV